MQVKQCAAVTSTTAASVELLSPGSASTNEESEYDSDINMNCALYKGIVNTGSHKHKHS